MHLFSIKSINDLLHYNALKVRNCVLRDITTLDVFNINGHMYIL